MCQHVLAIISYVIHKKKDPYLCQKKHYNLQHKVVAGKNGQYSTLAYSAHGACKVAGTVFRFRQEADNFKNIADHLLVQNHFCVKIVG